MNRPQLKPFLRWAGGKRWLFQTGQFVLPDFTGEYVEPFLGGGAVFFENRPKSAVLSDINGRLVELYLAVKNQATELQKLMMEHSNSHSKVYYYKIRAENFDEPVLRAAQFLYLNRTCWNGLYRENQNGQFNVPIGTKQNVIAEEDDFDAWSLALQGAQIKHQDFELTIDATSEGDFIFVDPPYTVRHNMNGFVKYNQKIFSWSDQVRLRNALERAVDRGALFALTNADHQSLRDLYNGFGNHIQIGRHSIISGKASGRSFCTELLVTYSKSHLAQCALDAQDQPLVNYSGITVTDPTIPKFVIR